ncbi:general transcription factor II-I repeat domain-containing protein 2-like [Lasioglossum baleicum]|uniref:general transcription factor II-I repeat domain-containing protein 2-like n=1 Tax=Lasioglossum baleicum TaxID=434251 RepID=UPI003FCED36C
MDEPSTSTPKRHFKPAWEEMYFFTEHRGTPKCLICRKVFNSLKKYNLQRHYNRYHAKDYAGYSREERFAELDRLKCKLLDIEAVLLEEEEKVLVNEPEVRASYNIALEIAKAGRPFSDGEFIKRCLLATTEQLWPDAVQTVQEVNVSSQRIRSCIREMAKNVTQQLTAISKKFVAFSLALDQTTNVLGTSQLVVFIRGVDETLTVTEELLDIFPPGESTRGEDIVSCVEEAIEQNNLDWCKLVAVATDGTPAMVDSHSGFVGCLQSKLRNLAVPQDVVAIHSIIHQETLCIKCIQFDHVMSVVVQAINFIRAHGFKCWQFRSFLEVLEVEYGQLPYHIDVGSIGRTNILEKFYNLRVDIHFLMDAAGYVVPELQDGDWIADLSFMCDILQHVGILNESLQEQGKTIINLFDSIESFKLKLKFWIEQLERRNTYHFTKLSSVSSEIKFDKYINVLKNLGEEFSLRFSEITKIENDFNLVTMPFSIDIEAVPSPLQLEIIDLRCDRNLRHEFMNKVDILSFYKNFPKSRFPGLHMCAARLIAMFGSTYICEKFFSISKKAESAYKYVISDHDLKDVKNTVILGTVESIVPNIVESIERRMPAQHSICVITDN